MRLTILGTGNATVKRCYNTCFALTDDEKRTFLVDCGGGNGILARLEDADISLKNIHDVFLTHEHIDHTLGALWVIRLIGQMMNKGKYEGNLTIYLHKELEEKIRLFAEMTIQKKVTKHFDNRIIFDVVDDGESRTIMDCPVTFFDIASTKAKQFGFTMQIPKEKSAEDREIKFTCLGDEPYNPVEEPYVTGSDWMLHEAFCLYGEADIFEPYEKHHSTVKEACELAESLHMPNVILYHTEETHLSDRKKLYTEEGKQYYHGNLYVPDDMDEFEI